MIDFKRLKDLREDHDLSQKEMAKILHVNRSTYSLWEIGINIIPIKYLSQFADYFNCSIDYILGLSNDKNNIYLKKSFDKKTLGNNLKKLRLSNNLSQENMADIIGVSQACIVKYEKGIIDISTSNLYKYSKKFNISINTLCGRDKKVKIINK